MKAKTCIFGNHFLKNEYFVHFSNFSVDGWEDGLTTFRENEIETAWDLPLLNFFAHAVVLCQKDATLLQLLGVGLKYVKLRNDKLPSSLCNTQVARGKK